MRTEQRQADILEGREPAPKRHKKRTNYKNLFVKIQAPPPVQSVQQQQPQPQPSQPQPQQPPQQTPPVSQQPQQQPQAFIPPDVAQQLHQLNQLMVSFVLYKSQQEQLNQERDQRDAERDRRDAERDRRDAGRDQREAEMKAKLEVLEKENQQLRLTDVEQGSSIRLLQESNNRLATEVIALKEKQLRLEGPSNVDQDSEETEDDEDGGEGSKE